MRLTLLSICAILFVVACKKKEETPACVAGTGGNVTLVASIKHHEVPIYSYDNYKDTLYIKYNAKDFPGTNPASYDVKFIGEKGGNHLHVSGLKCGQYFLFAVGLDTTIHERVFGGIPFEITATSGEVNVTVPVVE